MNCTAALFVHATETLASARDYYVSAAGNDTTGDGSQAYPWQTIAKLNTLDLEPGDQIFFRRGDTFTGPILLDVNDSATDATGVLTGQPISFRAFGEGPLPVISSPHTHGLHAVDAGGIDVRDLEFAGTATPDEIVAPTNTTNGLLFENTHSDIRLEHLSLYHLVVHGFGEAGINISAVNPDTTSGGFVDVRVSRSSLHDNGRSGIMTSIRSDSGRVVDGSLFAFQARAHADVYVRNNVVHHTTGKNEQSGSSGNGIVLSQVDGALIEYNLAHENGGVAGGGGVAVWTWESDHVTIQHNEAYATASFDGRDGGGFDLDGGARHSRLQYNYSHRNQGAAYGLFQFAYASPMHGNVIRYNVSEADGSGLSVWGNGPRDGTVNDVAGASLAYNNTIVYPRGPGADFFGSVTQVGVYNTIFLSADGQPLVKRTDFDGSGSGFTLDCELLNNLYWPGTEPVHISWDGTNYTSLAAWAGTTGQETMNGTLIALFGDPGLQGPFTGGEIIEDPRRLRKLTPYRLLPESRARDAGITVATLPLPLALGVADSGRRDFYGMPLPQGPRFDLGAHERR